MIPHIESGVPGFDEFTSPDMGNGGIPENTVTLVYGPPKTGKSILCNQFLFSGLKNEEPCLYIATDQGLSQLQDVMREFHWFIDLFLENHFLYIIDAISDIYANNLEKSDNIFYSYANNPTDLMVKVVAGIRFVNQKNPRFRSVLDSLTTLLAFNDHMLVMRVLKAYIMRIKEAGGTAFITYTDGSADITTETIIKSMVDNIFRLDGENLQVEAMKGIGKRDAPYEITGKGLIIE